MEAVPRPLRAERIAAEERRRKAAAAAAEFGDRGLELAAVAGVAAVWTTVGRQGLVEHLLGHFDDYDP
ncbi:hypothetical protein L9G15_26870, partial [Shewanella sp. A3A]|nr:hypothetical protein [Shewanella ferrihydritica]